MDSKERRHCQRYPVHYPIILSSHRAIGSEQGWHHGVIIDAGKDGIRLRVDDFGSIPIGSTLRLICQPVTDNGPDNRCLPTPIQGKVVWQDSANQEFAMAYTQI